MPRSSKPLRRQILLLLPVGLCALGLALAVSRSLEEKESVPLEPSQDLPPPPSLEGGGTQDDLFLYPRIALDEEPISVVETVLEGQDAFLLRMAEGGIEWASLSGSEQEALAHKIGRILLEKTAMLTEKDKLVEGLRRLPSIDSVASLAGASVSSEDRAAIEKTILPYYQSRLSALVPVAVEDTNAMVLDLFDKKSYVLETNSGIKTGALVSAHPRGVYRWSTLTALVGTPYTMSFDFNSGAYAPLEATFFKIKELKSQYEAEVFSYFSK